MSAFDDILVMQNAAKISELSEQVNGAWQAWTPALTWYGATPLGVTAITRYTKIGKTVRYNVYITASNGNDASTRLQIPLPIAPKAQSMFPTFTVMQTVGTTNTTRSGYIRDDGTNNDIYVLITTLTAGSTAAVRISGFYEVD